MIDIGLSRHGSYKTDIQFEKNWEETEVSTGFHNAFLSEKSWKTFSAGSFGEITKLVFWALKNLS